MTDSSLAGRVAVVTGAGGGLGGAICSALARAGAAVAAVDRRPDGIERLARELCAEGARVEAVCADVGDEDAVRALAATVAERLAPPGILVNNAAIYPRRPWHEVSVAEWDEVLAVNVRACFLCARAFAGGLRASGHGRVDQPLVDHLLQGLRGAARLRDVEGRGRRLHARARARARPRGRDGELRRPGAIPTDAEKIHPDLAAYERHVWSSRPSSAVAARRTSPHLVAFLASDGAAFISGQTIVVDGGWVTH